MDNDGAEDGEALEIAGQSWMQDVSSSSTLPCVTENASEAHTTPWRNRNPTAIPEVGRGAIGALADALRIDIETEHPVVKDRATGGSTRPRRCLWISSIAARRWKVIPTALRER